MTDLDAEQTIRILDRPGHRSAFYESRRRADPEGMGLVPPSLRPLVLLALANAAGDAAIVPLAPAIRDDLGLSGVELGALFATTTLAVLLTSVPAGQLAARVGSRPLLLGSSLLAPLALGLMAASPSLSLLLAGRIAFGVAFAVFWSVAPAVAASRLPGASGSGPIVAASGVGWLAGPLVAGLLADVAGWRLPLVVIAVLSAPVALSFTRTVPRASVARPVPLRATAGLIASSATVAWAIATAALLGAVTGAIGVLVPTVLAENGLTAAGIGSAVAVASAVWVGAGLLASRIGGARIDVRLVGGAVAALAVCWALPLASLSSVAVVGFLVLAAACRALLGSVVYPLASGEAGGEAATASLSGVLNLAWALAALVAPLLAGAAVEQGAVRAAFAVVAALAALVAAGMLARGRSVATA
jgi:predicted MFS family arabinose efflux permease